MMIDEEILETLGHVENFDKLLFAIKFGSQVDGSATKNSDTDIALYYELPHGQLTQQDIKVKAALPDNIDVSMFQQLPIYIRQKVFSGKLLHTKDKKKVYDIAYDTQKKYNLNRPLYLEVIG